MPVYDEHLGRVVVRVVYDGPGMAGKTTNVRKLNEIFSSSRSSELDTFGETAGRTTYFDWFSMDSGLVHGQPLRTEFVTVPGQRVLARRRMALVDHADAIIFVVDAAQSRLADGRQMFLVLKEHLTRTKRTALPIIIQVNKQDVPGAVSVEVVRRALELESGACIIPARAHQDVGVRECAVLAIRAAANRAQELIVGGGLSSITGSCGSPEALRLHLDQLEAQERLRPIEILRQHSSADADRAPLVETAKIRTSSLEEDSVSEESGSHAVSSEPTPSLVNSAPPSVPPFPQVQEEAGGVWPPVGGREIVGGLNQSAAQLIDSPTNHGVERTEAYCTYLVAPYVLTTRRDVSAVGLEKGRKLLVQEVRRHLLLGALLPESTVLTLQSDDSGTYFLWRIVPDLVTLDDSLRRSLGEGEGDEARSALSKIVRAATQGCRLALEQGIWIDPSPRCFGMQGGELRYLTDEIRMETDVRPWAKRLGRSIEAVLRTLKAWPDLSSFFTNALKDALATELSEEEQIELGLRDVLLGIGDDGALSATAS